MSSLWTNALWITILFDNAVRTRRTDEIIGTIFDSEGAWVFRHSRGLRLLKCLTRLWCFTLSCVCPMLLTIRAHTLKPRTSLQLHARSRPAAKIIYIIADIALTLRTFDTRFHELPLGVMPGNKRLLSNGAFYWNRRRDDLYMAQSCGTRQAIFTAPSETVLARLTECTRVVITLPFACITAESRLTLLGSSAAFFVLSLGQNALPFVGIEACARIKGGRYVSCDRLRTQILSDGGRKSHKQHREGDGRGFRDLHEWKVQCFVSEQTVTAVLVPWPHISTRPSVASQPTGSRR